MGSTQSRASSEQSQDVSGSSEGNPSTSEISQFRDPEAERQAYISLSSEESSANNNEISEMSQEDIASLKNVKSLIYSEDFQIIKKRIKSKDIVIFMGMSKCGKSTLINAAIGNKLRSDPTRLRRFRIIKDTDSPPGPEIGDSSVSQSTVPTAWNSRELNCIVLDAPGFVDNRGVAQDIANAFQLKEVISRAASVKIVLIADITDIIADKVADFLKLIDVVQSMFPNIERMFGGITLVLTKNKDSFTETEIQSHISKTIVNEDRLYLKNKKLVEYLTKSPSAVSIVRMPNREGVLEESYFDAVFHSIRRAEKISREDLMNISPGISENSRVFLLTNYSILTEKYLFSNFLHKIPERFHDVVNKYNPSQGMSHEEVLERNNEFLKFKLKVESVLKIKQPVNSKLRNVCALLFRSNEKDIFNMLNDTCDKLEFAAFIDGILNTNNCEQFDMVFNGIFEYIIISCDKQEVKYLQALQQLGSREAQAQYTRLERKFQEMQRLIQQLTEELRIRDDMNLRRQRMEMGIFTTVGMVLDAGFSWFWRLFV